MRIAVAIASVLFAADLTVTLAAGQSPSAKPPAPPLDIASAITATSGYETAVDINFSDEDRAKPAGRSFKNVQVMADLRTDRFLATMESMEPALGAPCARCHLQGSFEADGKPAKLITRNMFLLAYAINRDHFGGQVQVTCYTCHRGDAMIADPPAMGGTAATAVSWPEKLALPADKQQLPAGRVYGNLTVMADLPAGQIATAMVEFSTALGVGCDHCHAPGDPASDAVPAKAMARRMLAMVGALRAGGIETPKPIHCWTCHQGTTTPPRRDQYGQ